LKPQSQSIDNWLTMVEPEPEIGGAVAEFPGMIADTSVTTSTGSSAGSAAVNDRGEDLTVFFSIGVIIDVLLVAAFLVWAIGQWHKTKK
jgi:membrane protein DedA with SNARE-associated domain